MKLLLVRFIVVPLIIFTVLLLKGTKADVAPDKDCGNSTGEWTRVAYINIRDMQNNCSKKELMYTVEKACPDITCPEVPFCTRSKTKPQDNGCSSIKFETKRIPYNKVCGRARGYQYGFTRAFHSYEHARQRTLDDPYVSGLSVTRGEPGKREHIWTFAAGFSRAYGFATVNCPHALYPGPTAPTDIVGTNTSVTQGILTTVTSNGTWRTTTVCGPQQGVGKLNGSVLK